MPEMDKYKIDAQKAALVVVDIQEKLAGGMDESVLENVVRNTGILAAAAHELGLPIILTEQYPKGLGPTLEGVREAVGEVIPIEKMAFSCCGETKFLDALRETGARDVILCGMESHICILQTVLDLLEADYHVFVPADALCSRKKMNWRLGLEAMRQAGALVGSTEMFLFQLLGIAGTDSFKKLSKLVR